MMSVPILILNDYYKVNDWFLAVMIMTLLLMLIVMGPYRQAYVYSVSSMFRFKNPDGDVSYPLLSTMEYVLIFILSCLGVGIAVAIYSHDMLEEGLSLVVFLLWYCSIMVVFFLAKLLLYTIVNRALFNRQIITIKPSRWNCFFVMSFSAASFLILLFSFLVLFLDVPLVALLVFAYLMRALVITGRIFKMKTTLFKNKRTNSGFILYLCAFEIVPILVEFVFTGILFGLI